jgi:hypothetical protein
MNLMTRIVKLFIYITTSFICSCTQTTKENEIINNCVKEINIVNMESIFIEKNYSDNSYLDYFYLSDPENNFRLNGAIKSIQETASEISIKFDEENEEKLFVTNYEFNNFNNLTRKEFQNIEEDIVLAEENSKEYFLNEYNYSAYGLLINKVQKKISGINKNTDPEIQKQWYYSYNDENKLIKEVYKDPYQDSTVIKYNYFDNSLSEVFFYNSGGEKRFNATFYYDKNTISIKTNYNTLGPSELNVILDDPTEIILYFNNNCQLEKITKVNLFGSEKTGYNKKFNKIELNVEGDPISIISFNVDNLKNESFVYSEDFEYFDMKNKYSRYFEYKYDHQQNWTYKREGNKVFRRVIYYR